MGFASVDVIPAPLVIPAKAGIQRDLGSGFRTLRVYYIVVDYVKHGMTTPQLRCDGA